MRCVIYIDVVLCGMFYTSLIVNKYTLTCWSVSIASSSLQYVFIHLLMLRSVFSLSRCMDKLEVLPDGRFKIFLHRFFQLAVRLSAAVKRFHSRQLYYYEYSKYCPAAVSGFVTFIRNCQNAKLVFVHDKFERVI